MTQVHSKKSMSTHVYIVALAASLVVVFGLVLYRYQSKPKITNFAECVAAGNPVMESYPEQCSDGTQTFVNSVQ